MQQQRKTKTCRLPSCKKPFEPNTIWQKYCSPQCLHTASNRRRAKKIRQLKKFYEEHTNDAA